MNSGIGNAIRQKLMQPGDTLQNPIAVIEYERAILGTCMISKTALVITMDSTEEEDYFLLGNKIVFRVIKELYDREELVDLITVSSKFKDDHEMKAHVVELTDSLVADENIEKYIKTLKEKSQLRNLEKLADRIKNVVRQDEKQEDILGAIEEDYQKSMYSKSTSKIHIAFEITGEAFEIMSNRVKRENVDGVKSGIQALDDLIGYFANGELAIIAGRPSMGKTSLVVTMMYNALVAGYRVGYISLEEKREDVIYRMWCIKELVNLFQTKKGFLTRSDFTKVAKASGVIASYPLFVDDAAEMTARGARASMRQMILNNQVDIIFSDHLQDHALQSDNENIELQKIMAVYKATAKMYRKPVVLASQLSRPDKKLKEVPRPKLSDLRGSGSIEQKADVVVFVHRQEYYTKADEDKGKAELIVAKQRFGPCETAHIEFVKESAFFRDITNATNF
jgi:replicative DNA helicase